MPLTDGLWSVSGNIVLSYNRGWLAEAVLSRAPPQSS
jgi:hypothetical protein